MNDRTLHETYIEAVNIAVAEDRYDLIEELVAAYPDAAAQLLSTEPALR